MKIRLFLVALIVISLALFASTKTVVSVFYKEKKPSQIVLSKVDSLLENYSQFYEIRYYDIEDDENAEIISENGLPEKHFPFAVVIGDKFTVKIGKRIASFVHFPEFMNGIGRHEGNWSLEDLQLALENPDLLSEKNILPVLDEEAETSDCEE